jgi:8-oxo-dGTP pyrophosphatase MutT (NUDIX family)
MKLADRLRTQLAEGHARDMPVAGMDTRDPRIKTDQILAPAAVLVAVTDRPEPGVILTQRSAALRKHPGQVAFPGGRIDAIDADEIAAALREAEEEIALDRAVVDIVGISDRYHTFTGFDIVPVLAVIPPDLPLVAQAGEVDALFEVPLAFLLDPANRTPHSGVYQGALRHYYEIMWGERRIWGVTAAIVANLSKRLGYDRSQAA